MSIPSNLSLAQLQEVVRAMRGTRKLFIVSMQNKLSLGANNAANVRSLITTLEEVLPTTNILCLNFGEYAAAVDDDWERLLAAVQKSHVGHIYISENMISPQMKRRFIAAVRENRRKARYRNVVQDTQFTQLFDRGCNPWYSMRRQINSYEANGQMQNNSADHLCRVNCRLHRCKGRNRRGTRCCLCVTEGEYCRWHRPA